MKKSLIELKDFPKDWKALENYNRYLDLKLKIVEVKYDIESNHHNYTSDEFNNKIEILKSYIEEFKDVLKNMEENGFDLKDLILLSLGIEVYK